MTDMADLMGAHWVLESKRGDHTNLVKYLRSGEPISKCAREYLAEELSKPAGARFSRQIRGRTVASEAKDKKVLRLAIKAKFKIACWRYQDAIDAIDDVDLLSDEEILAIPRDPVSARWRDVTDGEALDLLSESGFEFTQDDLNNAMRRFPKWKQRCNKEPLVTFFIF